MELYTLDREYLKKNVIDGFHSIIWTERYYGDSEVKLVVPVNKNMIEQLSMGTFLSLEESDELMILETMNIKDGKITLSGISVLKWLNNRFIRTSSSHKDEYWYLEGETAGWVLWAMVYYMCVGGDYLDGTIPTGIPNPESLAIPGLGLDDYDKSGSSLKVALKYGPLYDAMLEFAKAYEIGMQIILDFNSSTPLKFRSYKGLDRTSIQTDVPVVRFSPEMNSFTDTEEIQSISSYKTNVYSFVPGLDPEEGQPDLRTTPGIGILPGEHSGFDLRAKLIFSSDITTDQVGGSSATLLEILNNRAQTELSNSKYVKTVDGEIVPDSQFQYGTHYNLGDIIEVEGETGIVQRSRITEYIRSQDNTGEKAYPTVTAIE